MTDPLSDPRAQDLLAALPDDVSALAANFRTAAHESHETARGLRAARNDGVWTGRAANAFRRAIGRLPLELDKVRTGFVEVADALTTYEPQLARIKNDFVQTIGSLNDAQARLAPAHATAKAARTTLRTVAHGQAVKPGALTADELSVARAEGAVGDLHVEITRLNRRAYDLLDEFSSVRHACRAAVSAARSTAPVRPHDQGTTVVGTAGPVNGPGGANGNGHGGRGNGHGGRGNGGGGSGGHGGAANIPAGHARQKVATMIKTADSLLGKPYVYGGGHGGWGTTGGLDCSGFVSAVLHSAGYLNAPQSTEGFAGQPGIVAGHGHYVTIYDRTACGANEHVIINLNGQFYEEGGGSGSGGAACVHKFTPSASYLASFNTILHPAGL
jgi:cell wall-associated NlpC family hydrolase